MKVSEQSISRLFWRMKEMYGAPWVSRFSGTLTEGKALWLEELKKFKDIDIAKALKVVKAVYPAKPPTLQEFSALVLNQKNYKPGYQGHAEFISEPDIEKNKAAEATGRTHLSEIRGGLEYDHDEYCQMINDCSERESKLNDWENSFISSCLETVVDKDIMASPKQREIINRIWKKVT